MELILITGGQRSGKSRYAQQLALAATPNPVYLATSRRWDADHAERIARHQADRDGSWTNLESDVHLELPALADRVVVLDCITLWLTNLFTDTHYDRDASLQRATALWAGLAAHPPAQLLAVTNEIGMGLHADTPAGRAFTDLQGWFNQQVAAQADRVFFMVAGLPLRVK